MTPDDDNNDPPLRVKFALWKLAQIADSVEMLATTPSEMARMWPPVEIASLPVRDL